MGAKRKSAFTLIELLVVIGIIMILASILTPGLLKAKKKATQAACLANVKAIGSAMMLYADDNNNEFPYGTTTLIGFGLMYDNEDFTELGVFKCPQSRTTAPTSDGTDGAALLLGSKGAIDYCIIPAFEDSSGSAEAPTTSDPSSNVLLVEKFDKGESITLWDKGDNHSNGGNCYFINGSAKFIKTTPPKNRCFANGADTYNSFDEAISDGT